MAKNFRKQVTVDGVEYVAHQKKMKKREDAYDCEGCVFEHENNPKEDLKIKAFCLAAARQGIKVWFEKKHKERKG